MCATEWGMARDKPTNTTTAVLLAYTGGGEAVEKFRC